MNIPGVVLGEEIGAGGFATVHRGTQTVIGRDVAVKIDSRTLTAERDRRRFEREVTALGTVASHPNIVSLYDAGIGADDRPYLVMELCTGGSYGQRIKASGPVAVDETIDVGIAIADALAAAHERGILHRDVKPGNILISQYGNPLLADFGLAALPKPGFDVSVTLESLTPAYSAPETFEMQPPTVAADVFSLGATLYAMVQGRPPHSDVSGQPPSLPRLLFLLNAPLPALPGVPEALMQVIWRATAAAPADRYPDAAALRDALRQLRPGAHTGPITGSGSIPPVAIPFAVAPVPPGRDTATATLGAAGPGDHTVLRSLLDGDAEQAQGDRKRRGYVLAGLATAAVVITAITVGPRLVDSSGVAQAPPAAVLDTAVLNAPTRTQQTEAPRPSAAVAPTSGAPTTREVAGTQPAVATTAPEPPAPGECFGGMVTIAGVVTAAAVDCAEPHFYESFAVGVLSADARSVAIGDLLSDPAVVATCTSENLMAYLGLTTDTPPQIPGDAPPPKDDNNGGPGKGNAPGNKGSDDKKDDKKPKDDKDDKKSKDDKDDKKGKDKPKDTGDGGPKQTAPAPVVSAVAPIVPAAPVETAVPEPVATAVPEPSETPKDVLAEYTIDVLPPSEARFLSGDRVFRCLTSQADAGEVTGHLSAN